MFIRNPLNLTRWYPSRFGLEGMIHREDAKSAKKESAQRQISLESRRMAVRWAFCPPQLNSFALFAPSRWFNFSVVSSEAGGKTPPLRVRAFTLIELLVVIGVIAILGALLLAGFNVARKSSNTLYGKQQMQTLVAALHAYQQDFRSYPQNPFAMIDQSMSVTPFDGYQPAPPRTDPTLAMALLGPGAASSVFGYANGDTDGADGPGFKTQMSILPYNVILTATSGMSSLAVTGSPPTVDTTTNPPPFTAISLGGPNSPDALVPIINCTSGSITLRRPLIGNYKSAPCALLVPTGATWGPYIKADDFKVAYARVPFGLQPASVSEYATTTAGTIGPVTEPAGYERIPVPVLLDRWGGPILYFPAYNAYTGRLVSPTNPITAGGVLPGGIKTTAPVSVGPIFGMPNGQYGTQLTLVAPIQYGNCGHNSAIDITNKLTIPSVFWSGPLGMTPPIRPAGFPPPPALVPADPSTKPPTPAHISPFSHGQIAAVLYKLGDINGDNAIDSSSGAKSPPEAFSLSDPFFLMSPGPDGVFAELYRGADATSATASPQNIVGNSDDIYSFEQ